MSNLKILRWHSFWISLLWISALLLGYWLLDPIWPYARRWILLAALVQGYGLWLLWHHLPFNHRAGESKLFTTLGIANHLSLIRGLSASLIAGFLFSPWPTGLLAWVPGVLYLIACLLDYLDGYVARRANQVTLLGEKLDLQFDSLSMLIVTTLGVWYGQLGWWFLGIGLAYYLFVLGMGWRRWQEMPLYEMSPSVHRRIFAGYLMGFACASLAPALPAATIQLASVIFGGAVGLGFLRDWLVVIGYLDPNTTPYREVQRTIFIGTVQYLPILLRLILLIYVASIYMDRPLTWLVLWTIVVGLLTIVGILGRASALMLLFPLLFDITLHGLGFYNGIAWLCTCMLLLLGTGYFSLWQPRVKNFILWI